MIKWLKIALLNWVMRDLWKAAIDTSYLKVDQSMGSIYLLENEDSKDGEKLSSDDVREYISEAKVIVDFPLFKKMNESMRNVANRMIFVKSKTIDDILAGKMLLWGIEVMEKKYSNIAKLKVAEKKKV